MMTLLVLLSVLAQPVPPPYRLQFDPGLSNGISRSYQNKMRDFVSVGDFGAACDGVTNDRTAIQNALTYAASFGQFGTPLTLLLPTGKTCFIGSGAGLTYGSALVLMLEGQGSTLSWTGSTGTGFNFGDANNVSSWRTIENIAVDCSGVPNNVGSTLLSGPSCVVLDGINQSTIRNVTVTGPNGSGANLAYGLKITASGSGTYNQRTTFQDIRLSGDFDYGMELAAPLAPQGHLALEHVFNNIVISRKTNTNSLLNLRGTIGFHYGVSTYTNTASYITASGFDIGLDFGGIGFRGFWMQPENNGTAVLFRSEVNGTFTQVAGNEITIDSPGDNGTLLIGQYGFPWKTGVVYQTGHVPPIVNGVGAWRTNNRGAGAIGIYRLANVPGAPAALTNPCTSGVTAPVHTTNAASGCAAGVNGTLDGAAGSCCWQYYADLNINTNDNIRYNTARRYSDFSSNILTGENAGDNQEQGTTENNAGAGPTGTVLYRNPSNAGLDFLLEAGGIGNGGNGAEQVVRLGFSHSLNQSINGGGTPEWYLQKSAAANPTLSVVDAVNSSTKLTFTQGTVGIQPQSVSCDALGTPANGTMVYCSNCTKGSNPCTGSLVACGNVASTGTFAYRINGAWVCF